MQMIDEEKNGLTKQSKSHWKSAHVKGDDADLDSVSIVHPDHPLTLVVVEGIKSSGVSVHVAPATVVCRSIAVVPGQILWMIDWIPNTQILNTHYPVPNN